MIYEFNDLYMVTHSEQTNLYTAWIRVDQGFFFKKIGYKKLGEFKTSKRAWKEILKYDCE